MIKVKLWNIEKVAKWKIQSMHYQNKTSKKIKKFFNLLGKKTMFRFFWFLVAVNAAGKVKR